MFGKVTVRGGLQGWLEPLEMHLSWSATRKRYRFFRNSNFIDNK